MGNFYGFPGTQKMMHPTVAAAGTAATGPLWGRSLAWLLFLGPFFFVSYGYTNDLAAQSGVTDTFVFKWEHSIPFVPWTILPYWSIDLFYGISFLLCRDRRQVDSHALRLLTAQLVSVACFVLFPLHYSFERPPVDSVFGPLFDALMGFDKPYNQAPSLHISLLLILWARFANSAPSPWRLIVHIWSVLIGISVLTTYQHHFIDIPTGALVGLFCLWAWPDSGASPLLRGQFARTGRHVQLAACYLAGALAAAAIAASLGGIALCLWWGTVALGLVALLYGWTGATGFQKQDGRHSLAVAAMLAPYLVAAWLNSRWWTRHNREPDAIVADVFLGRFPAASDMKKGNFGALYDVSAELPAPRGQWQYMGAAWLDLVAPDATQLAQAAHDIESLRVHGAVLVCCALGYSRSACALLAWLLVTGRANNVEAAEAILRARRPQIVLSPAHRAGLVQLMRNEASGVPP